MTTTANKISQHKNGSNSVNPTEIVLKCIIIVDFGHDIAHYCMKLCATLFRRMDQKGYKSVISQHKMNLVKKLWHERQQPMCNPSRNADGQFIISVLAFNKMTQSLIFFLLPASFY